MTPVYITKLGLAIKMTDVDAQKIYGLSLKIYEMAIVRFSTWNKSEKI